MYHIFEFVLIRNVFLIICNKIVLKLMCLFNFDPALSIIMCDCPCDIGMYCLCIKSCMVI